ncbi:MAG: DNA gyrase inhibitor YacG [Pyrinomonadaceae bacterium]|nr:DNA gyrase inhibitor YacG [Pyrinomonadaceae bacterium]
MPIVKCPTCRRETEYTGNEFRPFCSKRCKLIDFGEWADGKYALPTQETELGEEDFDEIERLLKEKEASQ